MVGPWPHRAVTFRALSKTYGQMWLRCDVYRRYARLKLAGLHDVDYRTKTFRCSVCGSDAHLCLVEPIMEFGMHDYRLDEVEKPERHPDAVKRLTERPRRTVSSTGAVDALSSAIEFQQAMAEANKNEPSDTAIVFRIGLHLSDLIVEGEDLYGDGVNIAARLEAEAPPGGIVVSRAVREAVEGRLKAKLLALGELSLKNIERPIRAFGVKWEPADWKVEVASAVEPVIAASLTADVPLALPDKPDRVLEDVFAVQEEVTRAIVAAIAPQIETTEQSKATRRRPGNLSAYEIAIRAWAPAGEGGDKVDRAPIDQSIREAKDALAIDPSSVLALHALAWSHGHALSLQIAADREHALQEGMWAAMRAIELDGTDAHGYALRVWRYAQRTIGSLSRGACGCTSRPRDEPQRYIRATDSRRSGSCDR
jgi:hypothetical protein